MTTITHRLHTDSVHKVIGISGDNMRDASESFCRTVWLQAGPPFGPGGIGQHEPDNVERDCGVELCMVSAAGNGMRWKWPMAGMVCDECG